MSDALLLSSAPASTNTSGAFQLIATSSSRTIPGHRVHFRSRQIRNPPHRRDLATPVGTAGDKSGHGSSFESARFGR